MPLTVAMFRAAPGPGRAPRSGALRVVWAPDRSRYQ